MINSCLTSDSSSRIFSCRNPYSNSKTEFWTGKLCSGMCARLQKCAQTFSKISKLHLRRSLLILNSNLVSADVLFTMFSSTPLGNVASDNFFVSLIIAYHRSNKSSRIRFQKSLDFDFTVASRYFSEWHWFMKKHAPTIKTDDRENRFVFVLHMSDWFLKQIVLK